MGSVGNITSLSGGPVAPPGEREPVNVIIPIGGVGSRFAKQGYRYPKPLINIVGRPMLLWLIDNLSLQAGDSLWMAVNEDVDDEFRIGQLVAKSFPRIDFHLLRLRYQTKGASETLFIVTQSMGRSYLSRKTVSLDCDTIYWADVIGDIRRMPAGHGGCFYFQDDGDKPIFSYIKTERKYDDDNDDTVGLEYIVDIQEKRAISNKANTGAYVFPSARELNDWAARSLDMKRPDGEVVGEYYTSHMIALMIQSGAPFLGMPVAKTGFSCVGTPAQLEEMLRLLKKDSAEIPLKMKKRRFCFDLDSTLVGVPAVAGDYSTCPPIDRNIRLVQQLHKAGHYIIIATARRMRTHNGNMGSVIADIGPVTFAQLAKYDIPFDDIHFGKPWADVYVDDLAVNANLDTMKEIGWLLEEDPQALIAVNGEDSDGEEAKKKKNADEEAKKNGMVTARDFNTIQIIGDKVIKSSRSENILGELYFYSHMPQSLTPLFPEIYSVDYIKETGMFSCTMENRKGLTFSHMLVGRSITTGRLFNLLRALHAMHTSPSAGGTPSLSVPEALAEKFGEHSLARADGYVNIYANYGAKLRARYARHRAAYDALGPLAAELFSRLDEFLDTYEAEERGVHAAVIHGDPVFSNAILSRDESSISFIDVRSQLEDTLTPEGDVNYDLAKVLQSLCGYDHVLFMSANNHDLTGALDPSAGPVLDEADEMLLEKLQEAFFSFLEETYAARIHRKTLFRLAASLFFSLIPLHRPELHPAFLRLCKDTMDRASIIRASAPVRSASGANMILSPGGGLGRAAHGLSIQVKNRAGMMVQTSHIGGLRTPGPVVTPGSTAMPSPTTEFPPAPPSTGW